ncbi:MAG: hypothetical protein IKR86_01320 [Candidatus Methanomethylophilaceae archaeon]|nr:hypothetical protein [Candidatus Methanomethylophilaceae archaeon]
MEDGCSIVPLGEILDRYGNTMAPEILGRFEPVSESSPAEFLADKAIAMERRDLSRTYLAFDQSRRTILGFFAVGMKCISIPEDSLLSRSMLRQCNIDSASGVAQAFLLGQLARSRSSPKGFGDVLIDQAVDVIRKAKSLVGCRLLRLDCADELVPYYEKHGFRMIRKNSEKDLNQMMIIV